MITEDEYTQMQQHTRGEWVTRLYRGKCDVMVTTPGNEHPMYIAAVWKWPEEAANALLMAKSAGAISG